MNVVLFDSSSIIANIIGGLVSGGILVLVGYFVWKKQHLFSKKFDIYIKTFTQFRKIRSTFFMIIGMYEHDLNEYLKAFNLNKFVFDELDSIKYEFEIHFGKSHKDMFNRFNDVYSDYVFAIKNLSEASITGSEERLSMKILTDITTENPIFKKIDNSIEELCLLYNFNTNKFTINTKKKYNEKNQTS